MRKLGYLLSILGHAALLLAILAAEFKITIQPEPPRVVTVAIAEPPLPYYNGGGVPAGAPSGEGAPPASGESGAVGETGRGAAAGPAVPGSASASSPARRFSLRSSPEGDFRLAPVGKTPDPWAVPIGPVAPSRPLRLSANAYSPMAARSGSGGSGASGGVFLLPFDIREEAVAEWTASVLARIERNWIVPASARFAFSGRVQVTLTIERSGCSRALAVEPSSLPEPLSQAALQAVQVSLPFPALPENIAGETFAFTFVFVYNG